MINVDVYKFFDKFIPYFYADLKEEPRTEYLHALSIADNRNTNLPIQVHSEVLDLPLERRVFAMHEGQYYYCIRNGDQNTGGGIFRAIPKYEPKKDYKNTNLILTADQRVYLRTPVNDHLENSLLVLMNFEKKAITFQKIHNLAKKNLLGLILTAN